MEEHHGDERPTEHVSAIHVEERGTGASSAIFVHGVLSWGTDVRYGFGNQLPLAAEFRLRLLDRRGYGDSPDNEGDVTSDYEIDTDDVVGLLEQERGHLVGHSYGGVVAMLAAIRRPDLVDSLTLIQPGAMRPAEDHPIVAAMLARGRAAQQTAADQQTPAISAEDYIRASTEGMGMSAPDLTPRRLRAATTSIGERPCWDAEVPLEPLAAAPFPILMISGDWANAPDEYRRLAGEPLMAVADVIADRVGARHLQVPGYYPQVDAAEEVNAALRALWRGLA